MLAGLPSLALVLLLLFAHLAAASRPNFHAHFNSGEQVVLQTILGPKKSSTCQDVHALKFGDTCDNISKQNGMSIKELKEGNLGIQCENLQLGQTLCLSLFHDSHTKHTRKSHKEDQENGPVHLPQNSVFRIYIGVDWDNVYFTDLPLREDLEIHFILAFAIDTDQKGNATNGTFQPFWADNLTPDMVRKLKQEHKNVKVMMSLGGDSINSEFVFFAPDNESSWVKNAVASLSELGEKYNLDGIDIDYEHFVKGQDVSVFANCVGALIRELKKRGQLTIASIAPFDEVQSHYKALWDAHSDIIDYVNFQFYTYEADTSTNKLIELYNKANALYNGGRVLTSFTTDHPEGGKNFAPHHIFDASSLLLEQGLLPGMFSWVADTSAPSKFEHERQAEDLLRS